MTIDEAREHIGDGVVYRRPGDLAEDGTISSAGDHFVFVLYTGDRHAKATDPADLELLAASVVADKDVTDADPHGGEGLDTWEF